MQYVPVYTTNLSNKTTKSIAQYVRFRMPIKLVATRDIRSKVPAVVLYQTFNIFGFKLDRLMCLAPE